MASHRRKYFRRPTDEYVPTSLPGGRAPHLWLDDLRQMGSSLFDRLGRGFTLLRLNATAEVAALEQAAAVRGIPLTIPGRGAARSARVYGHDLALIRPDQYVAWRGDRLPNDLMPYWHA